MTTLFSESRTINDIAYYGSYLSIQEKHDTGEIVAVHDTISGTGTMDGRWLELGKQNQRAAQKHGQRGVTKELEVQEARELFFWLPNEWCSNDSKENQELVQNIAAQFKNKFGLECMAALHWNAAKTNFHCHVMYADRKMLKNPSKTIATRNEYYNDSWRRCTKENAVHVVKKGEIKEIKYFESKKDERCTTQRFKFKENQLDPWIADLTGQKIFDKNSLHIPQQKVGNCKTNAAKERIREENRMIKRYNELVDMLMTCDILSAEFDDFYRYLNDFGTDLVESDEPFAVDGTYLADLELAYERLRDFKSKYIQNKKSAPEHSKCVLTRTRNGKRIWKRVYDPNFCKTNQKIKLKEIESIFDLFDWIFQLLDFEKKESRWQKLNFHSSQIHFQSNSRLAEVEIGNECILASMQTIRRNNNGTYDVFLDLDQRIQNDGVELSMEEFLVKKGYLEYFER